MERIKNLSHFTGSLFLKGNINNMNYKVESIYLSSKSLNDGCHSFGASTKHIHIIPTCRHAFNCLFYYNNFVQTKSPPHFCRSLKAFGQQLRLSGKAAFPLSFNV
jgi:hypothetical protein